MINDIIITVHCSESQAIAIMVFHKPTTPSTYYMHATDEIFGSGIDYLCYKIFGSLGYSDMVRDLKCYPRNSSFMYES